MTDPTLITARDLIAAAEQERDLALGQVRLLEGRIKALEERCAGLQSELKPTGDVDHQLADFAHRVVHRIWNDACNQYHGDGPELHVMEDWLVYRLQQWTKKAAE